MGGWFTERLFTAFTVWLFIHIKATLLNKFYIAVEKAAAKRTDFFISVADAMTKQSLAAGIGSPEKYATAYSAIEEDDFLQPISDEAEKSVQAKIRHT